MLANLGKIRFAADDQNARLMFLARFFKVCLWNCACDFFNVSAEVVCPTALDAGTYEVYLRVKLTVCSFRRCEIAKRLFDASREFAFTRRASNYITDGTYHHFGTSHTKRQHKHFVFAARVVNTDMLPTCTAQFAVESLVVVTRDDD